MNTIIYHVQGSKTADITRYVYTGSEDVLSINDQFITDVLLNTNRGTDIITVDINHNNIKTVIKIVTSVYDKKYDTQMKVKHIRIYCDVVQQFTNLFNTSIKSLNIMIDKRAAAFGIGTIINIIDIIKDIIHKSITNNSDINQPKLTLESIENWRYIEGIKV